MLILSRKRDEVICIGDHITVMVAEIWGDKVRLGIEAPSEIPVHRKEVYDAIHATDPLPVPREFEPELRPTGDAEHFVREGLKALNLSCGYPAGTSAAQSTLTLAFEKLRKALALLMAGTPPVVHPGG